MFGPRTRISPSSAIFTSTPGNGLPTDPNRKSSARVARGGGGRLGHAPALEHQDAACVEELEDLLRDRGRARDGLLDAPPKMLRTFWNSACVGLVERLLQLRRDLFAALLHLAYLRAELHRLLELLLVGRVPRSAMRVDLLEHARHATGSRSASPPSGSG